ncbi:MAG: sugar phosphate isomerase/epimerase family protein [Pirellulales bacterium]
MSLTTRRRFLQTTLGSFAAAGLASQARIFSGSAFAADAKPWFDISLAQWSLNKAFFGRPGVTKLDPLDFAKIAKTEFDISAVEYVNQFYKGKAKDQAFLADLKKRADDHGVKNVLIMCDGEGNLGDPDDAKRTTAVENHYKWVDAAKYLGCHSIRVNAASDAKKTREEQQKLAADGLARLTDFASKQEINVIVENHGGLSSDGAWLAAVMKTVNNPRCGTLPDFGNFHSYDRYKGTEELMPFAKGVSAKSHDFDGEGNETKSDYAKLLKIVKDAGYKGYIGIEYEGSKLSEADGIRATKKLLEKYRT